MTLPTFADVILPVGFLEQFWNNDTCGKGSCGPASTAMCCRYVWGYSGISGVPVTQDIINIWNYLGGNPNGNDSNGTSLSQLVSAANGVFGIGTVYQTTSTLANIKNEIAAGNPVLVHVKAGDLTNRGYTYTGGHYIVAVGYNSDYLICNDPGTYLGYRKYYSNADMIKAMNDAGCGVLKGFYNTPQPPPSAPNPGSGACIQYVAHVANIGWQSWVQNGSTAGTTGQSKAIQALCIRSLNTTVSYRANVQSYGWQGWVSNGAMAGTTGINRRLEAIQITVGTGYSVSYQANVQDIGWQPVVANGAVAGTTGQSKRLEALRVWITDIASPTISSSSISPAMAAKSDTVSVTVNAADNVGVTSVTANGTALTDSNGVWSGNIAADSTLGLHSVAVVARDAAGNQVTNSNLSYRTAEVVGVNGRRIKDAISSTAGQYYLFKVWGKVENPNTNYFDIDDGSGTKIRVYAPGYTGITTGNYISARGILNTSTSPITLTCNPEYLQKYK